MSISIGIVFFTFATYPGTKGHSLKLALPDSRINARSHSFAVRIIPVSMMLSQLQIYTCLKTGCLKLI